MAPSRTTLEKKDVDELVEQAFSATGLQPSRVGFRRAVEKFLVAQTINERYFKTLSTALVLLGTTTPFLLSQSISHFSDPVVVVLLVIILAPVWLGVVVLQLFFPKDLLAQTLQAEMLRARLVTARLAGQLALHNFVQEVSLIDDSKTISLLSQMLDAAVRKELSRGSVDLKMLEEGINKDWRKTRIEFDLEPLDVQLAEQLTDIAHSVATASSEIFGGSDFKVKIYLRTEHEFSFAPTHHSQVRLLTAVARFPSKHAKDRKFGKSWINCRGAKADVWNAVDTGRVFVYKSVSSAAEDRVYPVIVCIPLPAGLGALTIEAADSTIFDTVYNDHFGEASPHAQTERIPLVSHKVTSDVQKSLAVATKELVVRAIQADIDRRVTR